MTDQTPFPANVDHLRRAFRRPRKIPGEAVAFAVGWVLMWLALVLFHRG